MDTDNMNRKYTFTTDMMIVMLLNENGYTIPEIALMLGRDVESIRNRVKMLLDTGRATKIHRYLMKSKGIYAKKWLC